MAAHCSREFILCVTKGQDLPCLSPQHHSDQEKKVCSVLPSLSLSLPGKTATWPQSKTSFPDTLHRDAQSHTLLVSADSHALCAYTSNSENDYIY